MSSKRGLGMLLGGALAMSVPSIGLAQKGDNARLDSQNSSECYKAYNVLSDTNEDMLNGVYKITPDKLSSNLERYKFCDYPSTLDTDREELIRSTEENIKLLQMYENLGGIISSDCGDGNVFDPQTGLCWTKHLSDERMNWFDAENYCGKLSLGGHSDWSLPSVEELKGLSQLIKNEDSGFFSRGIFWSSDELNTAGAWAVDLYYGPGYYGTKTHSAYVACVR